MLHSISKYIKKPALYEASTNKFWDDEHISKGMLQAHLNPSTDGATRNHNFVRTSVQWIAENFSVKQFPKLLDLGCGPGIYAELFTEQGYAVTGVDFSKRSIDYATTQSKKAELNIQYEYANYLDIKYTQAFDLITLIWCDYGALSTENRKVLLNNIYNALKPNGIFIFDVFSTQKYDSLTETKEYEYFPHGGFWSSKEHLCLNTSVLYKDTTALRQAIIVTQDTTACYNIWEHYFTQEEIRKEVECANMKIEAVYSNIAGETYTAGSETLCVIARK